MGSNIEERVVEMRFDNKQFEKNANETIKTLNTLDKSLDLKGSTEGFKALDKAARSVDLSSLEKSMDAVTNKISVVGTIGDQVIRNLTNKLVNFGTQWIKSLSIDQIRSGWTKYEAKANAVQVIMHATGLTIDKVNESLDDLTYYTDETSYRFDQMVDSISKFTGANIELADAEKAVEGIANWAATAGVGPEKAASAFYNLSQAMSSGALRMQDWKSIEILNMNTVEFEETAIRVAEEMIKDGRASKEMAAAFKKASPKVQGFRDSLSSGWLDKDVMLNVFKTFADRTTEFGLNAFHAAQEAKTFKDAVDAAKESVATGWSNVFEQIFGNYEEARVFWTDVANELIEVFSGPTNALSELLTSWHEQGGYVYFIDSIKNAWAGVKAIGEEVAAVFKEIFPGVGPEKLVEITKQLNDITLAFRNSVRKTSIEDYGLSDEDADTIGRTNDVMADTTLYLEEIDEKNRKVESNLAPLLETLEGVFSILKLITTITKAGFKIARPFVKLLVPIARIVGVITSALGRMSTAIANSILESKWFNGFLSFLEGVANSAASAIAWLSDKIASFLDRIARIPIVETAIDALSKLFDIISALTAPYISKATAAIDSFIAAVQEFAESHMSGFISDVGGALVAVGQAVVFAATEIYRYLVPAFNEISIFASKIWEKLKPLGGKFLEFWRKNVVPSTIIRNLITNLRIIATNVKDLATSLVTYIKNGGLLGAIQWVKDKFDELLWTIKHFKISRLLKESMDLTTFAGTVAGIYALYRAIKLVKSITSFLSSIPNALKSFTKGLAIKRIAVSIGILAASLWLLAKIDSDKIWNVATVLGVLAVGLIAFTIALGVVTAAMTAKEVLNPKATGKVVATMLALAAAVLILAIAMKKIADIPQDQLVNGGLALIALMGILVGAMMALSYVGNGIEKLGIGLLAIAAAVVLVVLAISKIKAIFDKFEASKDSVTRAVILFGAIVAVLLVLVFLLKRVEKETYTAAALIASIGVSLLLMSYAVSNLANMGVDDLKKAGWVLLGLIGSLLVLSLISRVMPKDGAKRIISLAAVILSFGAAIFIIARAIRMLGEIDADIAKAGLARLAVILLALVPVILAAGVARGGAGAIIGVAALIIVIVGALKFLAKQDLGEMMTSAVLLGSIMMAIGASLLMAAPAFKGNFGAVIGTVLLIGALVAGLYFLSQMDPAGLLASAVALGAVLNALGASMLIGSVGFKSINPVSMYSIAAVIVALSASLYFLSTMPVANMIVSAAALGVLLEVLADSIAKMSVGAIGINGNTAKRLAGVILAILIPLVGAIAVLSLVTKAAPIESTIAICGALAILLPELALIIKLLSTVTHVPSVRDAGKFALIITAVLLPICVALGVLSALAKNNLIDPSNLVAIATAIAEVTAAMVLPLVAIMAIGMVGGSGTVLNGLVGFMAIITGLMLFFSTLALLVQNLASDKYANLITGLDKVQEIIGKVGGVIGALVGGVIVGFTDVITDNMPDWGTNISKFLENLCPGIERFSALEVDENKANGLSALAKSILLLTAADILDGITSWFTGGVDFGKFAEDIAEMGPALHTFATETEGIDAESVSGAADAIESMSKVASTLTRRGGLLQKAVGEVESLDEFAAKLARSVADDGGFVAFANAAPLIAGNKVAMTDAALAIQDVVDVASKLNKTGGWLQKVTGEAESLDTFASTLAKSVENGGGFIAFAKAAPEIASYKTDIENVADVIDALVTVANKLKPNEENIGWGFYKTYAQNLGDFMKQFGDVTETTTEVLDNGDIEIRSDTVSKGIGTLMREFYQSLDGIDFDKLTEAAGAIEALAAVGNVVQDKSEQLNAFGLITWSEQTTSGLGSLLSAIQTYGPNLKNFADGWDNTTVYHLKKVTACISELANVEVLLGDNPSNAGALLLQLGENLLTSADYFSEAALKFGIVDTIRLENVMAWVQENIDGIELLGKTSVSAMVEEMKKSAEINSVVTASEIASVISEKLATDTTINKYKSAGQQVVIGFAQGITNEIWRAENAASSLSSRTIQAMKQVLGIASPSKVMRKLGDYAGEGFVLGIDDWLDKSYEAGDELAASVTNSVIGVLNYVQSLLNGDLVADMTIRPVLDLTDVQSGVNTIDSMFSNRQAILAQIDAESLEQSNEISELINVSWQILKEIQNGRDIYLDGKVLAGSMNRRLGRMEGL